MLLNIVAIIIISNFEVKILRLGEDILSMIPQLLGIKVEILTQTFLNPKLEIF